MVGEPKRQQLGPCGNVRGLGRIETPQHLYAIDDNERIVKTRAMPVSVICYVRVLQSMLSRLIWGDLSCSLWWMRPAGFGCTSATSLRCLGCNRAVHEFEVVI